VLARLFDLLRRQVAGVHVARHPPPPVDRATHEPLRPEVHGQEKPATLAGYEQVTVGAAEDPVADDAFHGLPHIRNGGSRRAQSSARPQPRSTDVIGSFRSV